MKSPRYFLFLITFCLSLTGCFRPVIPISTGPKYPIDVFYADQQPGRPYDDIKLLYISEEVPIRANQKRSDGRMLSRGNSMLEKDALLAKLTLQAQRLGATALINVTYQYYTTATTNGYSMEGLAVKYRGEQEAN
ncbi:hypothetical protein [Fibrella aquatilis]|uniref:YbjQ family protein n=1 Tax=Fibrella aquatilis TaxID=2817059 RepID=A0A939JXK9_9BACT|nr:hypothetical protein [Fibrella aquatilis]MBO0933067.1 hypothetical protein [Fibrella aquatilis]